MCKILKIVQSQQRGKISLSNCSDHSQQSLKTGLERIRLFACNFNCTSTYKAQEYIRIQKYPAPKNVKFAKSGIH